MQFTKMNRKASWTRLFITTVLLFSTGNYGIGAIRGEEKHSMLYWAELLIGHITPGNTDYRHKETQVTWAGENNDNFKSYTDCSGLINSLLKQTYQLDDRFFKTWLGKSRPLAYSYFDAITNGNHFKKIDNINDIQAGDLLVIKYADRSEHEDNTGHCMLVISSPHRRIASALLEPGTEQYEAGVIDSSKKPHGKTDTRHTPAGDDYPGAGKGTFRLYADSHGNIKGYSWSTGKPVPGFDPFANPVIAGRIQF